MQIELMQTSMKLKAGQAIMVSRANMVKAAEGNIKSLLFDCVRESDIKEFAEQIERNWGVTMTEEPMTGDWTMLKDKDNE
jgi:hypothetical protein